MSRSDARIFRTLALNHAKSIDGSDFAGQIDPPPLADSPEAFGRDVAILLSAYSWTLTEDGYLVGLVAGDMGYACTSIKLDDETMHVVGPALRGSP